MSLEDELADLESGAETDAEQIDEETELEDVESYLDDEVMDPTDLTTDLEHAYRTFESNSGFEGEEVDPTASGLIEETITNETGMYLSEEGYHLEDPDGDDTSLDDLPDEGIMDDYDVDDLAEDSEEVTLVEPSDNDYGFEVVEIELNDDDIVRYIVNEDDEEIGFVLLEDGEEVEYYYVEDEDEVFEDDDEDNEYDLGITKEGVAAATSDMNAIYKDGVAVAAELKDAFDDIKGALDFSFLKKK
ncbi:hypothetical protein AALA21_08575 [Eggerthellaceae bacterium 3-80]|nr:hypothetical protein D7W09_08620 [bacterium D16-34]